jgi:putative hydrolase of the HAD superfamily
MTRWILADYGGVISAPQAAATMTELAGLARQPPAEFSRRYWACRAAYDLGQPDGAYWSDVVGRELAPEPELVEALVRADVAGWMTLNPETLPALTASAARGGVRLALLSNAPESIAGAIDASRWSAAFDRRFYSCRLGLAKPDPAAYQAVLDELRAPPASVLFIDDRAENTRAAAALGLPAVTFTSAADLSRRLGAWESGGGAG